MLGNLEASNVKRRETVMETLIWNILGYITMPLIFVFGFAVTALLACMIMNALEIESLEN